MRSSQARMMYVALPVVVLGAAWLYAGPLNPPAGPIASTPGPEPRIAINDVNTPGDANSVFKITQPGSYFLTGNVTGVVGKHGIEITASGVTLDLNGFDLVGVAAMGAFDGVSVTAPSLANIAVVGGSIREWGDDGVDFGSVVVTNCRVERVHANNNLGIGILAGIASTVSHCSSSNNDSAGIVTGASGTIMHCAAYRNGSNGIVAGLGGTITQCASSFNANNGISTSGANLVVDCTVYSNFLSGIAVSSDCVIRGNDCKLNGNGGTGAGIQVTGSNNRIEGNNCVSSDTGIDVNAAGNVLVRNSCSNNITNWDIVANNIYGPIIDRTAPASAAATGNAAPSTLGSTDANANYSY